MASDGLVEQLHSAKQELVEAESKLEKAMGSLQAGVRADKVAISKVLEETFARLRAARTKLAAIETQMAEEKTPEK